jgi:hypothetical protein
VALFSYGSSLLVMGSELMCCLCQGSAVAKCMLLGSSVRREESDVLYVGVLLLVMYIT